VRPGRSTSVKSSTCGLYILSDIGNLLTPLFCPATRKVSCSISLRISSKSVNRLSTWRNWPHSVYGSAFGDGSSGNGVCMSWRTSGLRVTMPVPRGRKSRPTILLNVEFYEVWTVTTGRTFLGHLTFPTIDCRPRRRKSGLTFHFWLR
jgi:hypothetical protein